MGENMTWGLGIDDDSDDDENGEDILTTPRHGLPDEFIVKDGNEELTKDGNEVDDIINPGDDIDDDVIIEDDDMSVLDETEKGTDGLEDDELDDIINPVHDQQIDSFHDDVSVLNNDSLDELGN